MTTKLVLERPAHTPLHLVPSSISGDMHPGIKNMSQLVELVSLIQTS